MDNGKKCLELYTNPQFFLLEWVEEQKKLRSAAREQRLKRREERKAQKEKEGNKQAQAPKQIALMDKIVFDKDTGEKIVVKRERTSASSTNVRQSSLNLMKSESASKISQPTLEQGIPVQFTPVPTAFTVESTLELPSNDELMISSNEEFNSLAPPPPPDDYSQTYTQQMYSNDDEAPLPPDRSDIIYQTEQGPTQEELKQQALMQQQIQLQQQQYYQQQMLQQQYYQQQQELRRQQEMQQLHSSQLHQQQQSYIPPPPPNNSNAPPPPPIPNANYSPIAGSASNLSTQISSVQLRKAEPVTKKPVDSRTGLLDGIRGGIALRAVTKVDAPNKKEEAGLQSVAAILARRIAIAPEDSDDDDDDDDANWD